jgi:hypothetical protein
MTGFVSRDRDRLAQRWRQWPAAYPAAYTGMERDGEHRVHI